MPPGSDAPLPRKRRSRAAIIVIAFGIVAGVFTIGSLITFRIYRIPSGAMVPTIAVDDRVLVNRFSSRPERGHVIVFDFPEHPEQALVKRVVAVGGDRIEFRDGRVRINGWSVPRCYVGNYRYTAKDADDRPEV